MSYTGFILGVEKRAPVFFCAAKTILLVVHYYVCFLFLLPYESHYDGKTLRVYSICFRYLIVLNIRTQREKDTTINLFSFNDEATMVKTRQDRLISAEKRDKRRDQRECSSPSVRAERLAITKGIENEIVCKQEGLRGSRYGC